MKSRTAVPALAGLLLFLGFAFLIAGWPARVAGQRASHGHSGPATMTEAGMKRWAKTWWATHPRVGARSLKGSAVTYTVANFRFDADGNGATQVDTVTINVGESVTWEWLGGIHSVTNGATSDDPNAGALFDQPIDFDNSSFTFDFNTAGTFPFFCRPHEFDVMKGVVIVAGTAGVEHGPGALGFTGGPWPNPTGAGASFGFALRRPGRARAEVFDANGRRIAVVLDRDLGAGPHVGAWDGRTRSGAIAEAGLYYLRLRLPDYQQSRAIVIARWPDGAYRFSTFTPLGRSSGFSTVSITRRLRSSSSSLRSRVSGRDSP